MTRQELEQRFEKAQANVAKRQATMDKIVNKIGQETATKVEEIRGSALSWREKREMINTYVEKTLNKPTFVDGKWNIENSEYLDKVNQYYDNLLKMEELKETANNWKVKLEERINKDNAPKIQVLMDFLKKWRSNAYSWYINNAEKYIELKNNFESELEKHMNEYVAENGQFQNWSSKYRFERQFTANYYSSINALTMDIVGYSRDINKIDYDKLNKMLDAEVERKYEDLVNRVTAKAGIIEDVSSLRIGSQNGEINGFVKGSKRIVEVETISAGGYNIQCFHYRVLVK